MPDLVRVSLVTWARSHAVDMRSFLWHSSAKIWCHVGAFGIGAISHVGNFSQWITAIRNLRTFPTTNSSKNYHLAKCFVAIPHNYCFSPMSQLTGLSINQPNICEKACVIILCKG